VKHTRFEHVTQIVNIAQPNYIIIAVFLCPDLTGTTVIHCVVGFVVAIH